MRGTDNHRAGARWPSLGNLFCIPIYGVLVKFSFLLHACTDKQSLRLAVTSNMMSFGISTDDIKVLLRREFYSLQSLLSLLLSSMYTPFIQPLATDLT